MVVMTPKPVPGPRRRLSVAHLCDEVCLWNTSQTKMAKGVVRGVDHVTHKVRIKILEQHEFEAATLGKGNPDDMYFAKDGGFDGFSIVRKADGRARCGPNTSNRTRTQKHN
jgi:hypothetical protein